MPTISMGTQSVYYSVSGKGQVTVLFVHGSGADHSLWGLQLKELKDEFTVAAIDLNGHGQSAYRSGDGLNTYTEDVLAVLNDLARPTVVAGHSLGGALALNVALQRPQNLVGVALIDTGARLRVLPTLLQLLQDDFDGATDFLIGLLFHRPLPQVVQNARAQILNNGQRATVRDFQTCDRFNVSDRLGEIGVPASVIVGEQDQMTPLKYAQFLADGIAQSTLEIIPNAGHMPMVEQAETLNQCLRSFLKKFGS